jgi:RNA polymerase sigma-70 factor (ECF subfamily)
MSQWKFRSLTDAVEAHQDELRRFIFRRTGSAALADDVVQETWLRAFSTGVAMPDNPRGYVFRMASNLAVDHLRRGRVRDQSLSEGPVDDGIPSREPGPDSIVEGREEMAILMTAVKELPERCRAVFLLYRGQGLTMRQVAERLGISEKTVEKHIARAMVHCRQRLREAGRNV